MFSGVPCEHPGVLNEMCLKSADGTFKKKENRKKSRPLQFGFVFEQIVITCLQMLQFGLVLYPYGSVT